VTEQDTLIARARAWIAADPDPDTAAAGLALLEAGEPGALEAAFGARLEFGTAGMRGRLGPGPGSMNRALVRMVTAGLGRYLLATVPDATTRGVIIGRDGRRGSREFAEEAASVLAALGLPVYLFEGVVATPVLAHGVLYVGAAAGVMVTASHNPPEDNGYKVYWGNGAQIVPPHDAGISAEIDAVGSPALAETLALPEARARGLLRAVPDAAWADYQARVLAGRVHGVEAPLKVVYTAMHGVGWAPMRRIVAASGHAALIPVAAQVEPDGAFPTVRFPNPEEPGALDLAIATAREAGADLILANDPDADRLAVAVPDGAGWRTLTGNQVGVLMADDLLSHGPEAPDRLVATTLVSTSLLARIAAAHGALYAETLTGFKWIANKAIAHPGPFVMGFEEALGYTVGATVRDKDGISAALAMLDLASWCKAQGRSLLQQLEALYRRYGYLGSVQRSITLPGADGLARIRAMMAALRARPPREVEGVEVVRMRDVSLGTCTELATGQVTALDLPRSDVLSFDLADGSRLLARPSGTEPKIKFYVEVALDFLPGEGLSGIEARALVRGRALADALVARAGA